MGCCGCRPKSEVTENATLCTQVISYLMMYPSGTMVKNDTSGLLYLMDNHLCYEATMGSKLCCKCCKGSWDISKVKSIKVLVVGDGLQTPRGLARMHRGISPGLLISIANDRGDLNTLFVAAPDAHAFAPQLQKYIANDLEF